MAKGSREQVWVWLDDPAFGPLQHIGTLSKGDRGNVSFAYEPAWLKHAQGFPLDPELDMQQGEFHPANSNFGILMDSCPDRWGQTLMRRREIIEAKEKNHTPKTLGPWDFLLGVEDCTRMGALRYSLLEKKDYLANETLAAPPVARMAELQEIAYEISKKKQAEIGKLKEWLRVLVAPGASLGGARPKANITDDDGQLWIAKFPSADDEHDVALWEKLLHDLAADCDIDVPESKVLQVGDGFHTFMVKRFDRIDKRRKFYASAITLLHRVDSEDASYLELAEFISSLGNPEQINKDLRELFTRVVFNMITANRDDHLRNHGFIRTPGGWQLSPAFDMNPSFKKDEHVLSFDLSNRLPDLGVAIETAGFYRLNQEEAEVIIRKVKNIVENWQKRAIRLGLSKQECYEAEHLFLL